MVSIICASHFGLPPKFYPQIDWLDGMWHGNYNACAQTPMPERLVLEDFAFLSKFLTWVENSTVIFLLPLQSPSRSNFLFFTR